MVEERVKNQLQQEDDEKRGEDRAELSPDVLAGCEPRGVEDLADPELFIANDGHSGLHRHEERVV